MQDLPHCLIFLAGGNRLGETGPNWAADGINYLLMTSFNNRSPKEFIFNTEFDFRGMYIAILILIQLLIIGAFNLLALENWHFEMEYSKHSGQLF